MKNYPHQFSEFGRLRNTLSTIGWLNDSGADSTDDGVLGYGLVERGFYSFRGLRNPTPEQLRDRIQFELGKPPGSQGARTTARDLRRMLQDMGWIDGACILTDRGREVLASDVGSLSEQSLLAEGLLAISVPASSDHNVSHPAWVMLHLLAHSPSVERQGLELALEAENDSPAELARVKQLYAMDEGQRSAALSMKGVTTNQIANAKKIFPKLAVTAGLVEQGDKNIYSLTSVGRAVLDVPVNERGALLRTIATTSLQHHLVTTESVAALDRSRLPAGLTADEQRRAAELLLERTREHQSLVKDFARLIGDGNGKLYENSWSYDLLWEPPTGSKVFLFEMKTVRDDADKQARNALAQLSFYSHFYVAPKWLQFEVVKCAVFDRDPGAALTGFLTEFGIAVIVQSKGEFEGFNQGGMGLLAALRPRPGG